MQQERFSAQMCWAEGLRLGGRPESRLPVMPEESPRLLRRPRSLVVGGTGIQQGSLVLTLAAQSQSSTGQQEIGAGKQTGRAHWHLGFNLSLQKRAF